MFFLHILALTKKIKLWIKLKKLLNVTIQRVDSALEPNDSRSVKIQNSQFRKVINVFLCSLTSLGSESQWLGHVTNHFIHRFQAGLCKVLRKPFGSGHNLQVWASLKLVFDQFTWWSKFGVNNYMRLKFASFIMKR